MRCAREDLGARLERTGDRLVWAGIRVLGWAQGLAPMRTTGLKIEMLLEAYIDAVKIPPDPPPKTVVPTTRAPWQREPRP